MKIIHWAGQCLKQNVYMIISFDENGNMQTSVTKTKKKKIINLPLTADRKNIPQFCQNLTLLAI